MHFSNLTTFALQMTVISYQIRECRTMPLKRSRNSEKAKSGNPDQAFWYSQYISMILISQIRSISGFSDRYYNRDRRYVMWARKFHQSNGWCSYELGLWWPQIDNGPIVVGGLGDGQCTSGRSYLTLYIGPSSSINHNWQAIAECGHAYVVLRHELWESRNRWRLGL